MDCINTNSSQKNVKILFDTDIGSDVDDALALLLLLQMPSVELVGVTTVYGKVDIRAKVAKKILNAAQRDVPVVTGAAEPLHSNEQVWHTGTEGRGVLTAEEVAMPPERMGIVEGAADFIVAMTE